MALLDSALVFCEKQAVTAAAASTKAIDLRVGRDIGNSADLVIRAFVDVAFTDTDSNSTLTLTLRTSDNADMSSADTLQTLGVFPALTAADTLNYFKVDAENLKPFKRYIDVYFTPTGGNLTTGTLSVRMASSAERNRIYPTNTKIS